MKMKFECIKGLADTENTNVVCMQGDIVEYISNDEGEVLVEGKAGWCSGLELSFTPKQFVEHFRCFGLVITI